MKFSMKLLLAVMALSSLAGCAQPYVDPNAGYFQHQSDMQDWESIQSEAYRASNRCYTTEMQTPHFAIKGYEDVTEAAGVKRENCLKEIDRKLDLELAKQPQAVQTEVREKRAAAIKEANSKNRFDGIHDEVIGGSNTSEADAIRDNTRAIQAQTQQMQVQGIIDGFSR